MFTIWLIGALFTDGLLDPHNKQGGWKGSKRIFIWPCELGAWLHHYLNREQL